VAAEGVPPVPTDNTFRVMTAFVRSPPVGVGALEEQVASHKLGPNVHGRDLPRRDTVVDTVEIPSPVLYRGDQRIAAPGLPFHFRHPDRVALVEHRFSWDKPARAPKLVIIGP